MSKSKRRAECVLRYTKAEISRSTVRRYYLQWRSEQNPPLPVRCDNPECCFYTEPLVWNSAPLIPILDHVDGVNSDNRPHKLRLLCPNCDSQLKTRGGGNKGRTDKAQGGFAIKGRDGKTHYTLVAESGLFTIKMGDSPLDGHGETKLLPEQFDNNVLVGGGTVVMGDQKWTVPTGHSHTIETEKTSTTLAVQADAHDEPGGISRSLGLIRSQTREAP